MTSLGDLKDLDALARLGFAERRVLLQMLAAKEPGSGRDIYASALTDGRLEPPVAEALFAQLTELVSEEPGTPSDFAALAGEVTGVLSALAADPSDPRQNLDHLLAGSPGWRGEGGEGA